MALRSILIADDEEPIRHVLTVLLSEHGFFVRAVKDGEEALRELSARDYDALVSDVRMPRVDGLQLVRSVQEQSPDTTVIVMSAYGSHELALQAMKAGAYDYLGSRSGRTRCCSSCARPRSASACERRTGACGARSRRRAAPARSWPNQRQ